MNKHLLALAAAATFAAPSMAQNVVSPRAPAAPAQAESSVVIYGITDAGFVRSSDIGGASRLGLDSGYLQSSRIGFRGTEELGGGLRTLFTLESGISLDTGANASATTFFNRQAFVGLASNELGTFTMGRQYTTVYDNLILSSGAPAFGISGGAVDGIGTAGATVGRFDNTLGGTRINNSAKYMSPTYAGWRVNGMLGLGDVAGSSSAGRTVAIGAAYNQGPISAGTAYMTRNCMDATGCRATEAQNKLFAIGGSYDFGPAKLSAVFSNEKNGKWVKDSDANVYHVMVQVPVDAWLLAVGYQRLDDKSARNEDVRQFNLMAIYSLSRRTSLYAAYSDQKVANGGKASMALGISSDSRQNVAAVGLRHRF
jgi:predicted porin